MTLRIKILLATAGAAVAAAVVWHQLGSGRAPTPRAELHHPGEVTCVVFSPDGKFLVSAVPFDAVRVWNVGRERVPAGKVESSASTIAFLADSATVAAVRDGNEVDSADITFIDAARGKVLKAIRTDHGALRRIAISPAGDRMAALSADGWLQIFATEREQEPLRVHFGPAPAHAQALAFSPDGRYVAHDAKYAIRLCDVETGQTVRSFDGHGDVTVGATRYAGFVQAIAFSPDGSQLVSAGNDNTLRIWETATGETRHVLRGHRGPVQAVTFARKGDVVLSGGEDGTIRAWERATGRSMKTVMAHGMGAHGDTDRRRDVFSLAVSPDGKTVASGGRDGFVRCWSIDDLVGE